jgi:D-amino peptidase
MKVYISADIEGVSGTTTFTEASRNEAVYDEFRDQMVLETAAACEGALAAGATEILVKDAHGGANNLIAAELPRPTQLIRGWSGHPFCMVQELDSTFDCVLFVGYHARAGAGGNPLSHTLSSAKLHRIFLNEQPASEFLIHHYAAATLGVPVVLLTGDETICAEVYDTDPNIYTVAVKDAQGAATINMHPLDAVETIRAVSEAAVRNASKISPGIVPEKTSLRLVYKDQKDAYRCSHYPGAFLVEPYTVEFQSKDYFEILRALVFLV